MVKGIYYKQARYKLLKTFFVVAQKESITEAADSLFVSQPTVSLQIQALEREMGKKLFERRGPKIKLTPEGRTLYHLVQPLVAGVDSLKETFAASLGTIEDGDLSIAAGQSASLYILPDYIKRFNQKYPGIRIRLFNVTGQDGMKMLCADEVDLAFGPLLQEAEGISYKPSMSFNSILITAKDHPLTKLKKVTLRDISQYKLILPPKHLSTWRMVDTVFRQHNVKYTVGMEAGGWEIVKKYVEHGLGVSIVTDVCFTNAEKDNIASIALGQYFPARSYGIIVRRGKFFTPQARKFIQMFDGNFFSKQK